MYFVDEDEQAKKSNRLEIFLSGQKYLSPSD